MEIGGVSGMQLKCALECQQPTVCHVRLNASLRRAVTLPAKLEPRRHSDDNGQRTVRHNELHSRSPLRRRPTSVGGGSAEVGLARMETGCWSSLNPFCQRDVKDPLRISINLNRSAKDRAPDVLPVCKTLQFARGLSAIQLHQRATIEAPPKGALSTCGEPDESTGAIGLGRRAAASAPSPPPSAP
jgi:hypothetical protein